MPTDDADLTALFRDAVDDVRPSDRLGDLRRRTARRAPSGHGWRLALACAGAAVALVAASVLVDRPGAPPTPGPATAPGKDLAVAAYFAGGTTDGTRLYREFHPLPASTEPGATVLEALRLLEVDSGPADPDYTTSWPDGAFLTVDEQDAALVVELRPAAAPDALALQQAVFTAQAALARTVPVTFRSGGAVLAEGLTRDRTLLAAVNITDPAQGHTVDDRLTLRGTVGPAASGPDTVSWQLLATDGSVAANGTAPVSADAWETTADVADLSPGRYELQVGVDEHPDDTRAITVR